MQVTVRVTSSDIAKHEPIMHDCAISRATRRALGAHAPAIVLVTHARIVGAGAAGVEDILWTATLPPRAREARAALDDARRYVAPFNFEILLSDQVIT